VFGEIFRVSQEELLGKFDKDMKIIEEAARNDPFALIYEEELPIQD
jgi:hypothetical protein